MERNASQNAEITALYRMLALQFREMDIFHNVDNVDNVARFGHFDTGNCDHLTAYNHLRLLAR